MLYVVEEKCGNGAWLPKKVFMIHDWALNFVEGYGIGFIERIVRVIRKPRYRITQCFPLDAISKEYE